MLQSSLNLKAKLKQGKTVLGTWCEIPSTDVVNILAQAGLDFIIIDMEHGAMDFNLAAHMVIAAQVEGCTPLIRVPRNDKSDILRALDIGAAGIIVPHVSTVADRIKAIAALKFPPIGQRSLNPYTRAGNYQLSPNFTKIQNQTTFSMLIIEGQVGITNCQDIVADPQVDSIYIGAYDLSAALGIPGQTQSPLVRRRLNQIVKLAQAQKKFVGCMFHDKQELSYFKRIGIQFLCYKVDTAVIFDAFKQFRALI